MVQQVWGRETDTQECGWFTPVADSPHNPNATFAITNPNDGDGVIVITVTPNDGTVPYDLTLPEPTIATDPETDGVHLSGQPTVDVNTGVVTFPTVNDLDESAAAPVTLDLGALISTDHPTFTAGGDVVITGDETTGYTISYTDNDIVYNAGDNVTFVTNPDGSVTINAVDPDDGDVETVTGTFVDNADPDNPVIIAPDTCSPNSGVEVPTNPNDVFLTKRHVESPSDISYNSGATNIIANVEGGPPDPLLAAPIVNSVLLTGPLLTVPHIFNECNNMYAMLFNSAGRLLIDLWNSADTQQWSTNSSIAHQISINGGAFTTVQFLSNTSDIDNNSVGYSFVSKIDSLLIPPGGSFTFQWRTVFTNNNGALEDIKGVIFNQPSLRIDRLPFMAP